MDQDNKPDNPFVYPSEDKYPDGTICNKNYGKQLVDDFAETAMLGLISSGMYAPRTEHHFEKLSEHSYEIAQAMLKARKKFNL